MRLPGLPLQFWSEDVFRRIGNTVGTYLDHDKSYLSTAMMAYARILVHLDTKEVLQEHITLQWRNISRVQNLDYEGVPFRCKRCHKVGHLFQDCPLNMKNKAGEASKGEPVGINHLKDHPPSRGEAKNQARSEVAQGPRPKEASKKRANAQYRPPSPPLTTSRAAAGASGNPVRVLPSPVHLLIVLLSIHLLMKRWLQVRLYLLPL